MRDRIIIGAIAISQSWLSLLFLLYGLYLPPLLLFGLWGLINSVTLFSASIAARKSTLIWHLVFLAFVAYASAKAGSSPAHGRMGWFIELWALFSLAVIFYLARVLGYLGNIDN